MNSNDLRVRDAIRSNLNRGDELCTPIGVPFQIVSLDDVRLSFKAGKTTLRVAWSVLDGVPACMALFDRGEVAIGAKKGEADQGTLERFLQDGHGNQTMKPPTWLQFWKRLASARYSQNRARRSSASGSSRDGGLRHRSCQFRLSPAFGTLEVLSALATRYLETTASSRGEQPSTNQNICAAVTPVPTTVPIPTGAVRALARTRYGCPPTGVVGVQ